MLARASAHAVALRRNPIAQLCAVDDAVSPRPAAAPTPTPSRPRVRPHRVGARLHRLVEDAQQLLLVEHHLLAAQAGQVVQRRQLDGVHRAGLLAHAAVDAAQLVDDERLGVLLAVRPRRRGGHDVDAVGRAGGRAHVAGHALDAALLVAVEPMDAAVVGRQLRLLLRELLRDGARRRTGLGRVPDGRRQARRRWPAGTAARAGRSSAPCTHVTSFSAIGIVIVLHSALASAATDRSCAGPSVGCSAPWP